MQRALTKAKIIFVLPFILRKIMNFSLRFFKKHNSGKGVIDIVIKIYTNKQMLVGVMEYTLIPDELLTLHNLGHTVEKPQSLSGKFFPMDGAPKGNRTFPRG